MSADVAGYCPACGGKSLFLAAGGHVTCRRHDCPDPTAATDILHDGETQHVVVIGEASWTVRHPLIERLDDALLSCPLAGQIAAHDGPPFRPGRYRVFPGPGLGRWIPIADAAPDPEVSP